MFKLEGLERFDQSLNCCGLTGGALMVVAVLMAGCIYRVLPQTSLLKLWF